MALTYKSVIDEALKRLPALKPLHELERSRWNEGSPGVHTFFELVFNQFLLINAYAKPPDDAALSEALGFVEELAANPDECVRGIVEVTVCTRLNGDPTAFRIVEPFFGAATRKLCRASRKRWDREC